MAKITKEMLIADVIKQGNKDAIVEVLYSFGMHCLGCALARGETIEDAAVAHGVCVEEMITALNEAAES